jgi:ribonucleoside-diphosphate reductase alpha chain
VDGHDNIRNCTSVVDYVFRVLGLEYLNRTDLAHVLPEDVRSPGPRDVSHPVGFEHHRGNGGSTKKAAEVSAPRAREVAESGAATRLGKVPGDAPFCDQCGHITVRNGTCFKCLNCGTSMGCS